MTEKTNNAINPAAKASGDGTLDTATTDTLSSKLADAALTVLVRTCRQEVAAASNEDLKVVCAAMQAKSRQVIKQLTDDVHAAPWLSDAAFQVAALELAQAGIAVLRQRCRHQREKSPCS